VGDASTGDCVPPVLGLTIGPDVAGVGVSTTGDAVRLLVDGGSVGVPAGELDVIVSGVDCTGVKVVDGSSATGDCVAVGVGFSIGPDVWAVGVPPAGDAVKPLVEGGSVGVSTGEVDVIASGVD